MKIPCLTNRANDRIAPTVDVAAIAFYGEGSLEEGLRVPEPSSMGEYIEATA